MRARCGWVKVGLHPAERGWTRRDGGGDGEQPPSQNGWLPVPIPPSRDGSQPPSCRAGMDASLHPAEEGWTRRDGGRDGGKPPSQRGWHPASIPSRRDGGLHPRPSPSGWRSLSVRKVRRTRNPSIPGLDEGIHPYGAVIARDGLVAGSLCAQRTSKSASMRGAWFLIPRAVGHADSLAAGMRGTFAHLVRAP